MKDLEVAAKNHLYICFKIAFFKFISSSILFLAGCFMIGRGIEYGTVISIAGAFAMGWTGRGAIGIFKPR